MFFRKNLIFTALFSFSLVSSLSASSSKKEKIPIKLSYKTIGISNGGQIESITDNQVLYVDDYYIVPNSENETVDERGITRYRFTAFLGDTNTEVITTKLVVRLGNEMFDLTMELDPNRLKSSSESRFLLYYNSLWKK